MAKQKILLAGKRTGHGFVVGRQNLVDALGQADTIAVRLGDVFVGRAGLAQYLRYARVGAATVKVVPGKTSVRLEHGGAGKVELPKWKWINPGDRFEAQEDAVYVEVGPQDGYLPNVSSGELCRALERALIVQPKGESIYQGVVLQGIDNQLTIRSTDGYAIMELTLPAAASGKALITPEEARSMVKMLRKASRTSLEFKEVTREVFTEGATVTMSSTQLILLAGNLKLEAEPQWVDNHYMAAENVFDKKTPEEFSGSAYLTAKGVIEALQAAFVIAGYDDDKQADARGVLVSLAKGAVHLSSISRKDGLDFKIALDAETEGKGTTYLNARHLLSALRTLGNEAFEFKVPKGEQQPILMEGNGFRYLLMPLRKPQPQPVSGTASDTEEPPEMPLRQPQPQPVSGTASGEEPGEAA